MKILNILLLTLVTATLGSMAVGLLLSSYLSPNIAVPLSFILSIIIGFNSRYLVEKLIGYTLLDALKETMDLKKDE